jgi:hypothetical protein
MNNKLLMGGLAGAVASFLVGMVLYGMLLKDYLAANMMDDLGRGENMIMWAMIVGNLGFGLTTSLVIGKWAGSRTFMSGMQNGALWGLIAAIGYDFMSYGWSNMFDNMIVMFADMGIGIVMNAIIGGVVAWVWGMGKAAE